MPIDVLKSLVILSTQFQPWSNDWWLSNRDRWGPIRTYARINSDTMSARTGLSPSSISRYESATRTPTKGDAEKMRMAYSAALVNRVWQLDMAICLYDFMVAHDLDPDDGETTYDGEQAIRWITAVGDDHEHEDEEVTLDHLPSLRHVRSLQPPPEYRDENESFMGFLGFATSVEEEGAEAEEAGAP